MKRTLSAAALAVALAAPVAADRADDDLAAVKRAVGSSGQVEARPAPEDPRTPDEHATRDRSHRRDPQWFRVRIVDRGHKRARVSINLPLALVRAAGGDWRVDGCHGCKDAPTVGELLRTLSSGQSLVEIDGDDGTVRVWVD